MHEPHRAWATQGRKEAAAGSSWALVGELTRVVSAGATFVVLARLLGPDGFGEYAGVLALVSVFYPFANGGAGHLLIQRVARRPPVFPSAWSSALSITLIGGVACTLLVMVLRPLLLPRASLMVLVTLALSELLFAQAVELAGQAHQAHDDMRAATRVRALAATTRLGGVALFAVLVSDHTVVGWCMVYLVASIASGLLAISNVTSRHRAANRLVQPAMGDLRAGVPFALGLSSSQLQHDIDKTMLLRAGLAADAGIYAAGHRIVGYLFLPVRAVMASTYPRFFREGERSLTAAVGFARRLLLPTVAFALVLAAISFVILPPVTSLLGAGFSETASVVQALALLPLLHVLQYLPGNSLTGAGHVSLRTTLQMCAAGLNVVLNLVLIPTLSWKGAVVATYCAELFLVLSLWSSVLALLLRRPADGHLARLPA